MCRSGLTPPFLAGLSPGGYDVHETLSAVEFRGVSAELFCALLRKIGRGDQPQTVSYLNFFRSGCGWGGPGTPGGAEGSPGKHGCGLPASVCSGLGLGWDNGKGRSGKLLCWQSTGKAILAQRGSDLRGAACSCTLVGGELLPVHLFALLRGVVRFIGLLPVLQVVRNAMYFSAGTEPVSIRAVKVHISYSHSETGELNAIWTGTSAYLFIYFSKRVQHMT